MHTWTAAFFETSPSGASCANFRLIFCRGGSEFPVPSAGPVEGNFDDV
jgi:hypothetical protein